MRPLCQATENRCRPLKRTRFVPLRRSQHFRAGLSYVAAMRLIRLLFHLRWVTEIAYAYAVLTFTYPLRRGLDSLPFAAKICRNAGELRTPTPCLHSRTRYAVA